ncbi:ATP-binding protein [Uliginosibacterium sp. H1]|uniref:ATP-binding protein n=1 Tax=Uliginosibacterium sp. H1 TaxID=3114757 RepID=UPI002E194AFC|nr:ATP-binding protein [Uliginosibacterium sp. H1]
MPQTSSPPRGSLQRSLVSAALLVALMVLGLFLAGTWYFVYRPAARALAVAQFDNHARQVAARLGTQTERLEAITRLTREWGRRGLIDVTRVEDFNTLLRPLIDGGPSLSSMVAADDSGREVLLMRGPDRTWINRLTDPQRRGPQATFITWNAQWEKTAEVERQADYDARTRPWFQGGMALADGQQAFWTAPYIFRSTQEPGLSVVVRWHAADGRRVAMTHDVTLTDLTRFTQRIVVGKEGFVAVLAEGDRLLGLPRSTRFADELAIKAAVLKTPAELGLPVLDAGLRHWRGQPAGHSGLLRFEAEGSTWLAAFRPMQLGEQRLQVATFAPEADFVPLGWREALLVALLGAAAMLAAWWLAARLARRVARPLQQLVAEAERIGQLQLDEPVVVSHNWREIHALASAKETMRRALLDATRTQADVNRALIDEVGERQRAEVELARYQGQLEQLVAERTAQLEASNRELTEAMGELERAQAELIRNEKLASLGMLVAGVAHELNTPIGNALLSASALQDDARVLIEKASKRALRRSEFEDFLDALNEATDLLARNLARAGELIQHFKQMAVDQASDQRRVFRLRSVLEDVLASLGPRIKKTQHRIVFEAPVELEMDSYPGALGQIISNLIVNAEVHGFEGIAAGEVHISARAEGEDEVVLEFADNGVGIPSDRLPHIFDPFFTTKRGSGGSGIGLNIVYNLVGRVLGGHIEVRSAPGEGCRFTLTLPRIAPQRGED